MELTCVLDSAPIGPSRDQWPPPPPTTSIASVKKSHARFIVLANLLNHFSGGEEFMGSKKGQRSC